METIEDDKYRYMLSIIIPMYNCEPVIYRCLDSIDYTDAEIIVIDDGSVDNSANIVNLYAKNHKNIRLIRKPNGGPADARNWGIEAAQGKYIQFIDADDYICPGGIGRIIKLAEEENADVVKFVVRSVREGDSQIVESLDDFIFTTTIIKGEAEALQHCEISDFHVVDGIFRRDVIVDNNIRFHKDMFLREDDVFMCEFYCHATTVISTNIPIYCYVRSSNFSSTSKGGKQKIDKLIKSELQAILYRKEAIKIFCPGKVFPYERYKYMRYAFGCQNIMIKSGYYSFKEYYKQLQKFKSEDAWPISYKTFNIKHYERNLKKIVKIFFCNHPRLAWMFKGILYAKL